MTIEQKAINSLRYLSASMISNANSGHTGVSIGAATILFSLFKDHLVFNPQNSSFENRDRLVLSAGHAAPLLYAVENMFDFDVSFQDLKDLRKYGSKTPGHPEKGVTDGVEISTGPLGQGIANAVGLAIAEEFQGKKFNTINMDLFNNHTYCFCGDGCLMEGVALEAISLAGHLGLSKLIVLYDENNITIDGDLKISNSEFVEQKFRAQNWNVVKCSNGNNYKAVTNAIKKARKQTQKPTIVMFKTVIGYPSDRAGDPSIHGTPLTKNELSSLKMTLGLEEKEFEIPADVKLLCKQTVDKNLKIYEKWQKNFFLFEKTYPELFKDYNYFLKPKKINFSSFLKLFPENKALAGRDANKIILNAVASSWPNLLGGTADLGSSVRCVIDPGSDFSENNRAGRNIHFGIREHAMGAIANGIAAYSSLVPFTGTFLSFANYMIPPIRMAGMMKLFELFFFSHDSLLVGEDGPTHQPIEQLAFLRLTPGVDTYRPADETELLACYETAFQRRNPSCFVLSKSSTGKFISSYAGAKRGGYLVLDAGQKPDAVIFSTGTEIPLALSVAKSLHEKGKKVSVASIPSISVFESQSKEYQETVVCPSARLRISIEASNDQVWYKYIGQNGVYIGVDNYQKSGKGQTVYEKAGFNTKDIMKKIKEKM